MAERDAAQDEHRAFIEESYSRIAEIAREGHAAHGRGAIFMFEDAVLDVMSGQAASVTIEFVADGSEALARRGGWPTPEHAALVRSYDPEASMLVMVARRRDGRDLFTYQMAFGEHEAPSLVALRGRTGDGTEG